MKKIIVIFMILLVNCIYIKPTNANANDKSWPAIFYVPHADDEAIGMAGAIAEHKAAGRQVYVVLISSEQNAGLLNIMNGKTICGFSSKLGWSNHPYYHNFNFTNEQVDQLRNKEFASSVEALGVDKVFYGKDGQTIPDALFYSDYNKAVNQVEDIINYFETLYPGASHKLVSGARDKYYDGTNWVVNQTHKALYDAGVKYNKEHPKVTDMCFYRVYVYRNPAGNQEADKSDHIFDNKVEWQTKKQMALLTYKRYDPQNGLYALGYHSFPDLIDAAYGNEFTYVDYLPKKSN
jgi:hypothetical protein